MNPNEDAGNAQWTELTKSTKIPCPFCWLVYHDPDDFCSHLAKDHSMHRLPSAAMFERMLEKIAANNEIWKCFAAYRLHVKDEGKHTEYASVLACREPGKKCKSHCWMIRE